MPLAAFLLPILLLSSSFVSPYSSFFGADIIQEKQIQNKIYQSGIISTQLEKNEDIKRYIVFGKGKLDSSEINSLYTIESDNGFFSLIITDQNHAKQFSRTGLTVIPDFLVDLHSNNVIPDATNLGQITGSQKVFDNFGYTGKGVTIAIVDTGVDFSNPDISSSIARDKNNHPIMLDADGQGIILTNATFIASIDDNGLINNYTKKIPDGITSKVYKNRKGIFLDLNNNGKGTEIEIYNSFFPQAGPGPIFKGLLTDDMKIGNDNRNYIKSKSGIYHLGIIYQGALEGFAPRIQVVPVLFVDANIAGIYDTIIPDMSTSWEDYTRFDLKNGQNPKYDFDFTDEKPIILGSGNELLTYDSNNDGKVDYTAGTIGAQVLDVYGVIKNKIPKIDKNLKALNGTLLSSLDPHGMYFGVMTDFMGHGTSSASTIVSKGIQEYDIYNNTKKYIIKGIAPDSKIIPIKALWFGDSLYAWLWASGFDNDNRNWTYSGKPRVDIISNSWGISNFPILQHAPGLDIQSQIVNVLSTPQSISNDYPGVTFVSSAGNSGHGYGTISTPNSASFGITVGATTNNVFVGYGPFKDQPRFGNTTTHRNDIIDFSSRGPTIIGDTKPDIMGLGAYGFTPSSMLKLKKNDKSQSFSLFGGTSMAAPVVSGTAALLIQSLQNKSQYYDPFVIKNILMSTANDLENDPMTQGSGLVNIDDAIKFVDGKDGVFIVYNSDSYHNIRNVIDDSLNPIDIQNIGLSTPKYSNKNFPLTSWYGGQLEPGKKTNTKFTINNPNDFPIQVNVHPQKMNLIQVLKYDSITEVKSIDPILNKEGVYAPNYIKLSDIKKSKNLSEFFDEKLIPDDATLLVLNVNFPFVQFMNKTDPMFANDMKISSLYLYDWNDKNKDTSISSNELSLINRGGTWGTVQELRVTNPNEQFFGIPLVGIYPVPTRSSYWLGDTKLDSPSMNYTLSASYYKKSNWNIIWTDKNSITVPPKSTAQISASITVPFNYQPGIYQGFLKFQSKDHEVNAPISFVVTYPIDSTSSIVFEGNSKDDITYGNGYLKGAFDMVNRYMAGDWRQSYFEIKNNSTNAAAIQISWKEKDTNIAAFVVDPTGKIIQTNMPSGVFGEFMGWASLDWLGTTSFSQGGGFYPVKNKDDTSTVLYVPINQTGTYSLLMHSTLFGGDSSTEPFTISTKFIQLQNNDPSPLIEFDIPKYINENFSVKPKITDNNLDYVQFLLDNKEVSSDNLNLKNLSESEHSINILAVDLSGKNTTKSFTFILDNSSPKISIKSPKQNLVVDKNIQIDFDVYDENLGVKNFSTIILPNGNKINDEKSYKFNTENLENGDYELKIIANDLANNMYTKLISFSVNHSSIQISGIGGSDLFVFYLIIGIIIGIAIGVGMMIVLKRKKN